MPNTCSNQVGALQAFVVRSTDAGVGNNYIGTTCAFNVTLSSSFFDKAK